VQGPMWHNAASGSIGHFNQGFLIEGTGACFGLGNSGKRIGVT